MSEDITSSVPHKACVMFCIGDYLNAVVIDASATTTKPAEDDDYRKRIISRDNTVDDDVLHHDRAVHSSLSNRQRQKLKRKLKKQQAIKLNGRQKARNIDQSLRLHQFVSTCFRSELNIAENGCGHFIHNAPKVSAHQRRSWSTTKIKPSYSSE